MTVEEIHFLPSEKSPEIYLNPDGIIKIRGRGFMFNNTEVPATVSEWIDSYVADPKDITYVNLAFEYLNSFTAKILVSILNKLTKLILLNKKLVIKWHYEHDDSDILERGEYISSAVDIPFEFIRTLNHIDH